MQTGNIRELGDWVIDFDTQTAYKYIGDEQFQVYSTRTRDGEVSIYSFSALPDTIQIYVRAKYPTIDIWGRVANHERILAQSNQ